MLAPKDHTSTDFIVDQDFVNKVETVSNILGKTMCDCFSIGQARQHKERAKKAMLVKDVSPPDI